SSSSSLSSSLYFDFLEGSSLSSDPPSHRSLNSSYSRLLGSSSRQMVSSISSSSRGFFLGTISKLDGLKNLLPGRTGLAISLTCTSKIMPPSPKCQKFWYIPPPGRLASANSLLYSCSPNIV